MHGYAGKFSFSLYSERMFRLHENVPEVSVTQNPFTSNIENVWNMYECERKLFVKTSDDSWGWGGGWGCEKYLSLHEKEKTEQRGRWTMVNEQRHWTQHMASSNSIWCKFLQIS